MSASLSFRISKEKWQLNCSLCYAFNMFTLYVHRPLVASTKIIVTVLVFVLFNSKILHFQYDKNKYDV